jgi:hypothetical protein
MDAALTVDIDMMDYRTGQPLDEMEAVFSRIREGLTAFPQIRTTWFFRIDRHMASVYGSETFLFDRYGQEMHWLRSRGHEIGWHFHGYQLVNGRWRQNVDEDEICDELRHCGQIARQLGLSTVRMGWAFHTNRTMGILDQLAFAVDCSALPRPSTGGPAAIDWTTTSQQAYQPSVLDYRIPGDPHLGIWEVPISTTGLRVPSDKDGNAVRYINPAYHSDIFERALESVRQRKTIVLLCHPYELLDGEDQGRHPLLAFDYRQFIRNLELLAHVPCRYRTVRELVP